MSERGPLTFSWYAYEEGICLPVSITAAACCRVVTAGSVFVIQPTVFLLFIDFWLLFPGLGGGQQNARGHMRSRSLSGRSMCVSFLASSSQAPLFQFIVFFPFMYFICQRWQRSTPFDHPLSLSCIMSMLLCIRCVSVTLLIFLWLNKMSALILWVAAVNSTWFLLDLEICVYVIVFKYVSFRFSFLC